MLELYCTAGETAMTEESSYSGRDTAELGKVGGGERKRHKATSLDVVNHHSGSVNSSEDPDIASTQAVKYVSSNARDHPQAELQASQTSSSTQSKTSSQPVANHSNHVVEKEKGGSRDTVSDGKKQRSEAEPEEEEVWTEHVSSSGRTYYYNKRLDKSQWERPKGLQKKTKTDSTPYSAGGVAKSSVAATPLSTPQSKPSQQEKSSREIPVSQHKSSGTSSSSRGSGHSRSNEYSHRDKERGSGHFTNREGGGTRDKHMSDRKRESYHHHHSSSSRLSRSHSRSSSPGSKHGHSSSSSSTSKSRGHYSHGKSSGHDRSGHDRSGHERHQKSSRSSHHHHHHHHHQRQHHQQQSQPSPSPVSTPKASGLAMISPTTPSASAVVTAAAPPGVTPSNTGPIPSSYSQALTTTQQLIDHNSLLIEQRQRLLQAGEATPTSAVTMGNQVQNGAVGPVTPAHTTLAARKRLALTPQQQQVPSPSYPTQTTPLQPSVVGGAFYAPQGGVSTGVPVGVASPQPTLDATGLHPLQRALLLQNQQLQHQAVPPGGVESGLQPPLPALQATPPVPQAPPSAIPYHMTALQSPHPSSPLIQSPVPMGTPTYPATMQPLTSTLQTAVFVMPQSGVPMNFDPTTLAVPQYPLLNSKVLQRPVSLLHQATPPLLPFPEGGQLEGVMPSQLNSDLVERELASLWLQHAEALSKQVIQCQVETLQRKTLDRFFVSGQLMRKRLLLAAGQHKTLSRGQRLKHLQGLLQELDKLDKR